MDYSSLTFDPSPSGPTSPRGPTGTSAFGNVTESLGQTEIPDTSFVEPPNDATVSIAFHPSLRVDDCLPDSIIVSSTHVYFYVHRHRINNASTNGFGGLFSDMLLFNLGFLSHISVPEGGDVINVLLHVIYGISCVHYHPMLETLDGTLAAMVRYGVPVQPHTVGQLYPLILAHAPYHPIEAYAIAAEHRLEELAIAVSGELLSLDTSWLTDALAEKMGPTYLMRLFLLHQHRVAMLKAILAKPPMAHLVTPGTACGEVEQDTLTRAWVSAAAQVVWDATPSQADTPSGAPPPEARDGSRPVMVSAVGIHTASLRAYLEPIGETISCEMCGHKLLQRIQDVVHSWSSIKTTV